MKKRATQHASRQQPGVRTLAAALLTPWLALQGCAKQEAPAQETGKSSATKQMIQTGPNTQAEILRTEDGAEYVPGKLIVRFKDGASKDLTASVHSKLGAQVVKTYQMSPELHVVAVKGDVKDAQAAYLADPRVAYAELNYVYRISGARTAAMPNDTRFGELWGMHNTGQSAGVADADINAPEAWELTTGSTTAGVITVIDTGIDYTHPDLAGNVWTNPGEIPGNGVDDDANGYIDDVHGINAITDSGNPMDDNDHGSHCMGSIAGHGNNGLGVAGVSWTAKVMGCKFLDASGSGTLDDAITCFDYVHMMKTRANNPVNIVATSNSWGGGGFNQAMLDGIIQHRNDGILFIAAAGNAAANNDTTAAYPNSYFVSNVISVGAHDRSNNLASFSSYGRRNVHVTAPGVAVLSTTPGNTYKSFDGTSMATPHVSGLVALLKAQDPSRDWKQLKNLVMTGGVTAPHATGKTLTGKRIRAADAGGKGSLTCNNQVLNTRVRPIANTASANVGQPLQLIAYNINCANPAGAPTITVAPSGATISLVDDGTNGDQTAGDGMYTGAFTPTSVGTFTLTFPDGEPLTVNAVVSYVEEPTAYNYRTITGTSLVLTDDSSATVTSPFPIPFAGGAGQTSLRVNMNGALAFGTTGTITWTNSALPTTASPTLVAPFWDDLFPGPTAADNVFWQVLGTAPNRELVIEWRNVYHRDARTATPPNTLTFQVVFFEGQSEILYAYKDVLVGNASYDKGAGATVGVQVGTGTATQHSFNTPSVADNTAILWRMPDLSIKPVVADLVLSPAALNEGDTLTIESSFTDADGDTDAPFKVEYDLDYTGLFNADVTQTLTAQGTLSTTSPVLASGEVKVAVRVTDKTGTRSVLKTATVTAQDVAPVVAEAGIVGDAKELNAVAFMATFADPGTDSPWKAEWDFNYDGTTFNADAQVTAAAAGVTTASHTYANDGTYTVAVRVADKDGVKSALKTFEVSVADLVPTLQPLVGNATTIEGETLSLASAFTDPGDGSKPWKLQWDFSYDGTSFNVDAEESQEAAGAISYKRFMEDSGAFTIAVRVVDADGSISAVQTANVTSADVSPVLSNLVAQSLSATQSEPQTVDFRLNARGGSLTAPAVDPILAYLWDFDGDGEFDYLSSSPRAIFRYTDDPASGDTYTVRVRVEDEDSYTEQTVSVTVLNSAPELAPIANQTITANTLLSVRAVATDKGSDTLTFSLVNAPQGMSITSDGLLLWQPTNKQARKPSQSYVATVKVSDDDGDSDSQEVSFTTLWQDTDSDGMPDEWEQANGTNPLVADANMDSNGDGVSNMAEFLNSNDGPQLPDTAVVKGPVSGEKVAALSLTTHNVADDGDLASRKYQFQLFSDTQLTQKVRDVTVEEDASGLTVAEITDGTQSDDLADLMDDAAYSWRVRATDGQFHGAWSQVQTITYNPVNDAPSIARAVQPMPSSQVASFNPVLTVDNATDADDAQLTYVFEVAENAALTTNMQASAPINGGVRGSTSWAVPTQLKDRTTYYWRVTAVDPHGARTEGEVASFTVFLGRAPNRQPGIPELSTAAVVETAEPMLVADAAMDLDGDTLTYVFELDTLASFSSADYQSSDAMVETNGQVSWKPATLKENTRYYWRVRASDNASASDWALGSFVVNARNDAPSAPVALSPSEALIITQKPTLTLQNAADPEGDAVTYEFEVRKADGSVAESIKGVAAGANGTTSATLTQDLVKGSQYTWVAYAKDAKGETSIVSAEARFQVYEAPVVQQPPQADTGCSAAPGASMAGLLPMLALAMGLLARRRRNS
jgi:uncharacterized protein (TIGR03382 family)